MMVKIGQMTELINDEVQKRIQAVIPEDMVFEILLRLPVKYVVRFRCVSKLWYSITSSSSFITAHLQNKRFTHQSLLIACDDDRSNTPFRTRLYLPSVDTNVDVRITLSELPHVKMLDHSSMLKSCDGLIYFYCCPMKRHCIINPLTSRYCILPQSTVRFNNLLGFYFHRPTSKYRLLAEEFDINTSFVLVVGENKWRRIHDRRPTFLNSSDSVDINKSLYWLSWKNPKHVKDGCLDIVPPTVVLIFDKETEAFSLLPLPPSEELNNRGGNLMNFKGELGLWVISNCGIINFWLFKECWIKRYSVYHPDLKGCPRNHKYFLGLDWQIGFAVSIKDEELLIVINGKTTEQHLVQWELTYGACFVQNFKKNYLWHEIMFPYIETLSSINHPSRRISTRRRTRPEPY